MFYGYCHETGRLRMMDLPDYVDNTQTAYSNMVSGMSSMYQPYMDMLQGNVPQGPAASHKHHGHHDDCGCQSHEHGHDCHCSCCIRCADVVEYARCGEVRMIPVTFENDTRRDRDVKLELSPFVTEGGKELWQGAISEPSFKLPPCGEKTVLVKVQVNCSNFDQSAAGATEEQGRLPATVDSCKVAYATLRADGCMIRPLVIALAVLPNDCGAHHAGCQCGCCC
ncbi:MAG: hypothetical protein V7641_5096 [Blastocatellia bacterium]